VVNVHFSPLGAAIVAKDSASENRGSRRIRFERRRVTP